MKTTKLQILFLAVGMAALGAPAINAGGGDKGNPNPDILPPHATYKGKTAGEWSVAYWQWVDETVDSPQMYDDTGEFAYVNNNGADGVFFLAKSWAGYPQERHVVIPSGTALFVPVMGLAQFERADQGGIDAFWDSLDEFLELQPLSNMNDLQVVIDGKPVAGLEDGNEYYVSYYGADGFEDGEFPRETWYYDNVVYEFMGYEIVLLLNPLPPGEHVIEMKGKYSDWFESDVTYHITVTPGRK